MTWYVCGCRTPLPSSARGGNSNFDLVLGAALKKRIDVWASESARTELWLPSWSPLNRPFAAKSFCRATARAFAKSINLHSPSSRRVALRA